MSAHTGRVESIHPEREEVLLTVGSAACRVCGGSGCALRGRNVRAAVALSPEDHLEPGCLVKVVVEPRAILRAVFRLLLAPGLAAIAVIVISGQPVPALAAAAAVIALSAIRGSKGSDLPRVVAVIAPASRPDPGSIPV
jgi:hypothetical protein